MAPGEVALLLHRFVASVHEPSTSRPETPTQSLPSGIVSRLRGMPCLRGERGLTLPELLILMAVIGGLSTIALLVYNDVTYQAQIARATADIGTLQGEIRSSRS